jgi:hypothetical protein
MAVVCPPSWQTNELVMLTNSATGVIVQALIERRRLKGASGIPAPWKDAGGHASSRRQQMPAATAPSTSASPSPTLINSTSTPTPSPPCACVALAKVGSPYDRLTRKQGRERECVAWLGFDEGGSGKDAVWEVRTTGAADAAVDAAADADLDLDEVTDQVVSSALPPTRIA